MPIASARSRPQWGLILALLAVLGQFAGPQLHARDWAGRTGDPLLYAFCGSPEFAWRLRAAQGLAEPLADLHQHTAQHFGKACDWCGVAAALLSAVQASAPTLPALPKPSFTQAGDSLSPVLAAPRHHALARGPPTVFVFALPA
jgi:hypothetical protein